MSVPYCGVSAGVPEMCAELCAETFNFNTSDATPHSELVTPPAGLRLRALGLLQCLFEAGLGNHPFNTSFTTL
jgi:hypothetical protein